MFNNKKAIVMYFISYPKIKITIASILALGFFSCGSYQYAGSDNDGIYSSEGEVVYVEKVEQSPAQEDNSYYQNYFKEKRMQYDAMNAESEIFTDADSYSSDGNYVEHDSLDNSYRGYGGWGSDSDEIVINYYNNNWVDPFWGPYGWGWSAGWGWGWNYPYYGWGWSTGWGWGWNYPYYGWGWGAGWGWNYPYYGWGWNYPYYGGYYYNRGVAINGRRGDARLAGSYNRSSLSSNRRNSLTRDYNAMRSDIRTRNSSEFSNNNVRTRSNYSTSRTRGNYSSGNTYSTSRTRNNSGYSSPSSSTSRNSSSSNSTVRPSRSSSSSSSSGGRSYSGGSTRSSSSSGGGRSSSGGSSGGGRRR